MDSVYYMEEKETQYFRDCFVSVRVGGRGTHSKGPLYKPSSQTADILFVHTVDIVRNI